MALVAVHDSAVLYMKPSTDPDHPWVVLCYDPSLRTQKYVVWNADDQGNTISGGYHSTLAEAREEFDSREEGEPPTG